MRTELDNPGRRVAATAGRQHGVVTRAQLREAGLSDTAVARELQRGRLHRIHRGVYAVGHTCLSREGRWMAAVLACGGDAVLSHRSAAVLWRLLNPERGPIHVAIPRTPGRSRRRGIQLHRCVSLDANSVTHRHRIPVTTPSRTIADLRGAISPARHRRALRQAEVLGLRTGIEATDPTRSELEDRFLRLCRRHRLPVPEVDVRVGNLEVDFLWRPQRLIVETDGYHFHRGATAFEDDHARDLDLHIRGFTVLRLTYRQVTEQPDRIASTLRDELERVNA